jgi:hypothetical protein
MHPNYEVLRHAMTDCATLSSRSEADRSKTGRTNAQKLFKLG